MRRTGDPKRNEPGAMRRPGSLGEEDALLAHRVRPRRPVAFVLAESVGAGSEVGHGHAKPPFVVRSAGERKPFSRTCGGKPNEGGAAWEALRRSAGTPADRKGPGTYRATVLTAPPMRMPMPQPAQCASRAGKQVIVGFIGSCRFAV